MVIPVHVSTSTQAETVTEHGTTEHTTPSSVTCTYSPRSVKADMASKWSALEGPPRCSALFAATYMPAEYHRLYFGRWLIRNNEHTLVRDENVEMSARE